MTILTTNIAQVGRLRALRKLRNKPLTDRTARAVSDKTSGRGKVLRESTLRRLVEFYDKIVGQPGALSNRLTPHSDR
jgi:hypothetical protein